MSVLAWRGFVLALALACGYASVLLLAVLWILYLSFVTIFQNLANRLRLKQEYYMDKHVMDRFIENHFDSSHNTFETARTLPEPSPPPPRVRACVRA